MEKRDPLQEVPNVTSNIEPQEAVGHASKQPEAVAEDKENGFPPKFPKVDVTDIGCGNFKPKESQPRRSVLKIFDPLYEESPKNVQLTSNPEQKIHRQIIIEDFDQSRGSQIQHSGEVSDDDETSFLDASTAVDEASSEKVIPGKETLKLEESLLKFETPEKVHVTPECSEGAENKSVLQSPQTSTSIIDQVDIETETVYAIPHDPDVIESEIVDKISRKLTSDCDIIPTRSKFTITESELENYNILREEFSNDHKDDLVPIQYNVADTVETNPLISVSEIRNISPEDESNVALKSFKIIDEPEDDQPTENIVGNQTTEKEESSDDSQESKITVIEKTSGTEIDSEADECVTADINKEAKIVLEPSIEECYISKKTESSGSPKITKGDEDIENSTEKEEESPYDIKFNAEKLLKRCQEVLEKESISEPETQNKEVEKVESGIQSSELQFEKVETEIECEDQVKTQTSSPGESRSQTNEVKELETECNLSPKLEEKLAEEQESAKEQTSDEICGSAQNTLESAYEVETQSKTLSEFDTESNSEIELKSEKLLENLEPDYKVQSEHQKPKSESEGEVRSDFEQKSEKFPPEPETSLSALDGIEHKQSEIEVCTDQKLENSEVHLESSCETVRDPDQRSEHSEVHGEIENSRTDKELEPCQVEEEVKGASPEAKPSSVAEVVPEKKTEESVENTLEPEKTCDVNTEVPSDSDSTYIHHDDELHLDSGVDSIEESYTKSPKSQRGDFEEIKKEEDQDIYSEKKDGSLPDEQLSHADEQSKESVGQVEESEIKDSVQNETSDATPRIERETTSVNEPGEPEIAKTAVLTENQKSDKKSSADSECFKAKMADLSEKLSEQQQENSDLKLQLNAIQQAKASLELEIRQKEEIIIKTQAEAMKNEQTFKQEIKQLREKLKENSKLIEKDGSKELEDQLKEAKVREAKVVAELNQKTKDDLNCQKIMEEYENTIATRFADYQKLKEEHETATRHLANIELAFSDVHQKYERTKALLESFKSNEEFLNAALQTSEKTCKQHEERYESLKAHAKGQIEKSNKEILTLRDKYEMDINKLKAIIKRLEIKCSSLEVSLQQKTEECGALAALCDEVTGKKV